jgi:hypothetical protein
MEKTRTLEEIQYTIKAALDSVWVIEDTIQQIANGEPANEQRKGNIERNVGHLKIVVSQPDLIESGEDISALQTAIEQGETILSESSWV